MYLAREILDRGPWDSTLSQFAGYTEQEIQPVFDIMIDFLQAPVAHEALFKKYASKKFLKGKSTSPVLKPLLTVPASIMARKWAKDYTQSTHDDAGVAVGDIDFK